MKNCLITGSGRSGTSMAAGTLAQAGYFMGEDLYPGRGSNPKGFFEAPEINNINELLIERIIPARPPVLGRWFFRDRPVYGQRWLARVPPGTEIQSTPDIVERIKDVTGKKPFCFKDPRFCYTLPVWRPFLKDTVFLCVFRHPADTAKSILKECSDMEYLRNLSISFERAVEVWTLMYRHVLEIHRHEGSWMFMHFNQVLSEEGMKRMEDFTGAAVDRGFPDHSLRRSVSDEPVMSEARKVYETLCELAGYGPRS